MFRKSVPVFSILKGDHKNGTFAKAGISQYSGFMSPMSYSNREEKIEAMKRAEKALKIEEFMKALQQY
jgi:hypothetical protein